MKGTACKVCGDPVYPNRAGLVRCETHYREYYAAAMRKRYWQAKQKRIAARERYLRAKQARLAATYSKIMKGAA